MNRKTIETVGAIINGHADNDLFALQIVKDKTDNQALKRAAHYAILDLTGQDSEALSEMHRNLGAALEG